MRVIDNHQLFDPVLMQQTLGICLRRSLVDGDDIASHQIGNLLRQVTGKAHIAVGQDTNQMMRAVTNAFNYRNAADRMRRHQFKRIAKRPLRRNGDRIHHHARFVFFDAGHLGGLGFGGHVLVDHPDTAGACHRNRQAMFGHRIHRGGNQRDIEIDGAGQTRRGIRLRG